MSLSILIVEDEELYASRLGMLIDQLGYKTSAIVGNSDLALIELEKEVPDLILLDIKIDGSMDGIQFGELVRSKYRVPFIYITSFFDDDTFKRAQSTSPINFLHKPISDLQLKRAIEISLNFISEIEEVTSRSIKNIEHVELSGNIQNSLLSQNLFIKSRQNIIKLPLKEVLYLEADGHYTKINTAIKSYLVRISLSEMAVKLNPESFMRTHRSFIININNIQSINLEESSIVFQTIQVPLSRSHRDKILQALDYI